jgi:hypothetical protein
MPPDCAPSKIVDLYRAHWLAGNPLGCRRLQDLAVSTHPKKLPPQTLAKPP